MNFPPCQHRPACDGCPHLELGLEESRRIRRETVEELARAYRARYGWTVAWAEQQPTRLEGWRNRARMVVTGEGELAFFRAGTREAVVIERCVAHHPRIEEILGELRQMPGLSRAEFVDVRVDPRTSAAIVTLSLPEPAEPRWEEGCLRFFAERWGEDEVGLQLNVGGPGAVVLGGEQRVARGPTELTMRVGELALGASPQAFFQTNVEVLEAIHASMREALEGAERVVDAFCGVGTHALSCAGAGAKVVGFDAEPASIEAARLNAQRLGFGERARFEVATDAEFRLEPQPGTAVIVNPARAGLSPGTPARLAELEPQLIVYLSCSATTLFRDAERLHALGWSPRSIELFDMMPGTEQVELMARFERRAAPSPPPAAAEQEGSIWWALVAGDPGRRASLPGGKVRLERMRKVESASVVRLFAGDEDSDELRALLRRWGHPVVGDDHRGVSSLNRRFLRDQGLDVPALVRVVGEGKKWLAPAHLVSMFRLPDAIVHEERRRR